VTGERIPGRLLAEGQAWGDSRHRIRAMAAAARFCQCRVAGITHRLLPSTSSLLYTHTLRVLTCLPRRRPHHRCLQHLCRQLLLRFTPPSRRHTLRAPYQLPPPNTEHRCARARGATWRTTLQHKRRRTRRGIVGRRRPHTACISGKTQGGSTKRRAPLVILWHCAARISTLLNFRCRLRASPACATDSAVRARRVS